jgi:hypothetical protein
MTLQGHPFGTMSSLKALPRVFKHATATPRGIDRSDPRNFDKAEWISFTRTNVFRVVLALSVLRCPVNAHPHGSHDLVRCVDIINDLNLPCLFSRSDFHVAVLSTVRIQSLRSRTVFSSSIHIKSLRPISPFARISQP